MSLTRKLIEAIRFARPVAILADPGSDGLKGIVPVLYFRMDDFRDTCNEMVHTIAKLHGVPVDDTDPYDPVMELDRLASFYRVVAFFFGPGPWGDGYDHAMLSTSDRPTLRPQTREWILKRIDPNPRDPIHWYRSLIGSSEKITYDHVLFAKSRPARVHSPNLNDPAFDLNINGDEAMDTPDPPPRRRLGSGRRLGQ